jgi:REP element-mobilizing transposase RayT
MIKEVNVRNARPYSIQQQDGIYFCTDIIMSFACVFVEKAFFDIIINSLKSCQQEKGLNIHAFVIMPNHVHTVLSSRNGMLAETIRDYKRFTSRRITEELQTGGQSQLRSLFVASADHANIGNDYKVWQSGSHPQIMDDEEKCTQKIEYIHNNPVRKGFVEKPEDWSYSSARNYLRGDDSIMPIDKLW